MFLIGSTEMAARGPNKSLQLTFLICVDSVAHVKKLAFLKETQSLINHVHRVVCIVATNQLGRGIICCFSFCYQVAFWDDDSWFPIVPHVAFQYPCGQLGGHEDCAVQC